jgi:NAD(P)-dependent dehydrogenase (short-subunit alcohol dehydrogenase family)
MEYKTGIVTGGMQGIGLAYVKALLERSYHVVIIDKHVDNDTIKLLESQFGESKIKNVIKDIKDKDNLIQGIIECNNILLKNDDKTVDVIVFNAGIYGFFFENMDDIFQINLLHAIRGSEMIIKDATDGLKVPSKKDVLIAITSSTNGIIPADSDFAPW